MANRSTFVGMDVHKESIDISVAEDGRQGEVRQLQDPAAVPLDGPAPTPHRPRRGRGRDLVSLLLQRATGTD
jgi:hypothetical protein